MRLAVTGSGSADGADGRMGRRSRSALDVFEVFASGSLTTRSTCLDDVSGKRIAIAPRELKERYRRAVGRAIGPGGAPRVD